MRPARLAGLASLALAVLAAGLVLVRPGREERSAPLPPTDAAGAPREEEARPAALAAPPAAPTPADPTGDAARAAVVVEPLVLVVRGPDGVPLEGGRVVVFRGAVVLGKAVIDATGEARFTLPEGEGEVAVWIPCLPAHRESLALQGRHELRLAGGAAVAGMVLVDGMPPSEPFDLQLCSDSQLRPMDFFPPSIMAALGLELSAFGALHARTELDGSFRFSGLPPGWSGHLRWEAEAFPSGDLSDPFTLPARKAALAEPREDVVLRLMAPGVIQARLLRTGPEPLGPAQVELDVPTNDFKPFAYDRAWFRDEVSEDGTYRALVQRPFPDEVIVRIGTSWRDGYTTRFRSPIGADRLWDLGDIVVPSEPELRVVVHNELGEPIAQAEVSDAYQMDALRGFHSGPYHRRFSRTGKVITDRTGTALLPAPEEMQLILVEHPSYAPSLERTPDDLQSAVTVTLRRPAQLLLDFQVLPLGSQQHLRASCEPQGLGSDRAWPLLTLSDPSFLLLVPGTVAAGVPFQLRVTDRFDRIVHEELISALAPGETRKQHVKVEWQPLTLHLSVLDSLNYPIAGAGIAFDGRYRLWTGPDGEAEQPGLVAGPLPLTLTHRLFVGRTLSDVELSASSDPLEVRLVHR